MGLLEKILRITFNFKTCQIRVTCYLFWEVKLLNVLSLVHAKVCQTYFQSMIWKLFEYFKTSSKIKRYRYT